MNKCLLSSVALFALSTAAIAADLPSHKSPAEYPAGLYLVSPQWTGVYVGFNGGYANGTFKDPYVTPYVGNFSAGGGLAGLQVGYNYQVNKYVIGVEVDYDWANLNTSKDTPVNFIFGGYSVVGTATAKTTQQSLGTVRLRLGYSITNGFLYATGGYAYGKAKIDLSGTGTVNHQLMSDATGTSQNHSGWVLGAGLEYDLGSHISAKAEYLHVNLGSKTYWEGTNLSDKVSLSDNVFRVGLNYRY